MKNKELGELIISALTEINEYISNMEVYVFILSVMGVLFCISVYSKIKEKLEDSKANEYRG